MNQTIETINHWGGHFLDFAWPMLWQSSLLILIVLALDWTLARKLRASIRHALWLVVLVKLLLPPTLALPTGVAWWLTPVKHQAPALPKYTVTYSQGNEPVEMPLATIPLPKPPPAQLNRAGWAFLATASVSTALLGWLLFRWIQVAAMVRRAADASDLAEALANARRQSGSRIRAQLKLVDDRLSPAVCGLFRPVILLPRQLAERLPANQLQAVLLHEFIHLRRADIWINCAQALLQILYWWHPLVWIANSRMRRVREEAVDDAVMLALNDDAELYAPTLLEVAKLAFHRPSLSLGLVGIMESRSALRQRIERLMDFRAPRHAGLTLASALAILAFSAVALPMGSASQPPLAEQSYIDPQTGLPAPAPVTHSLETNQPQIFITANLYWMSWPDIQKKFNISQLQPTPENNGDNFCWVGSPAEFKRYTDTLKSSGVKLFQAPRIVTCSGIPAEFFVGTVTNGFSLDCIPIVTNRQVQLALTATEIETAGRQRVTNTFSENVLVPDHGGFLVSPRRWNTLDDSNSLVALVKVQIVTNIPPSMSARTGGADEFYTRTFQLDRVLFPPALQRVVATHLKEAAPGHAGLADAGTNVPSRIRTLCKLDSIDLNSPPPGTSIFYNKTNGVLLVKAPKPALDYIDKIVQETVNSGGHPPAQIHLKARVYQLPAGTMDGFTHFLNATTNTPSGLTGILTPDNARAVIQALQAVKGSEVLAEPEVVTITGRHTQIRATHAVNVITNVVYEQNPTNPNGGSVTLQVGPLDFGPALDVVAYELADGYTISLAADAWDTQFWGYAEVPKQTPPIFSTNALGQFIPLPKIWPALQVLKNEAIANLYDGQTLLMVLDHADIMHMDIGPADKNRDVVIAKHIREGEKKNREGQVVVLITPTIVDPTGNRVHDDYLDINRQTFPPQPNAISPLGIFPGKSPGNK